MLNTSPVSVVLQCTSLSFCNNRSVLLYNLCDRGRTVHTHTHPHPHLMALCPWLPGWAGTGTRKVKPIWILLKQETVSGTMPAPSQAGWPSCHPTNSVKALKARTVQEELNRNEWMAVVTKVFILLHFFLISDSSCSEHCHLFLCFCHTCFRVKLIWMSVKEYC